MKHITTGVDKLVKLVSEQKRITLDQAAKQLNVGNDTVQEWAEFLEQEGLITVKYRFSKVWLEELKINERTGINIGKELIGEKDILRRKIEVALSRLQTEANALNDVKSEFNKIQSQIKNEVKAVEADLQALDRFDALKKKIDKEIEVQKKSYQEDIQGFIKEINKDAEVFDKLSKKADSQSAVIEGYKKDLAKLVQDKDKLSKVIDNAQNLLVSLNKSLAEHDKAIRVTQSNISELEKESVKLKESISVDKDKSVYTLLNKISEEKNKVLDAQDKLLKDSKEKTKSIAEHSQAGHKLYSDFKSFFDKKNKLESEIDVILNEKEALVSDFESLKDKIHAFNIVKDNPEVRNNLSDLQKLLEQYESRRLAVRKRIDALLSFIRG